MVENSQSAPDPGNAPPEEWATDLNPDEFDTAADSVNTVAMSLPPLPEEVE